jgi:hypothetical protein
MKKQLASLATATLAAWSSAAWADPPTPTPTPTPTSAHSGSQLRNAGWFTVGAGSVVLGTSAVFFVMSSSDHGKVTRDHDAKAADAFDRHFTTAKILAVAGVLGVAAGVTLILVAPNKNEVALSAGPGQLALSGTF